MQGHIKGGWFFIQFDIDNSLSFLLLLASFLKDNQKAWHTKFHWKIILNWPKLILKKYCILTNILIWWWTMIVGNLCNIANILLLFFQPFRQTHIPPFDSRKGNCSHWKCFKRLLFCRLQIVITKTVYKVVLLLISWDCGKKLTFCQVGHYVTA